MKTAAVLLDDGGFRIDALASFCVWKMNKDGATDDEISEYLEIPRIIVTKYLEFYNDMGNVLKGRSVKYNTKIEFRENDQYIVLPG